MDSSNLTEELRAAGPTVPLWPTAGQAMGVSRTHAYSLARAGTFPVPVLKLGQSYRVPTAELLRALGIEPNQSASAAAA